MAVPRGSSEDQAAVRQRLMRLSDEPSAVAASGRAPVPPPAAAGRAAALSAGAEDGESGRPSGVGGSAVGSGRPSRAGGSVLEPGRPSRAGGGSAFDPGRRGVRALAAVAAVVVLVAGAIAWFSRPRAEPVAAEPVPAATGGAEPAQAASSAGGAEVVVAVAGKVRKPGLVRLPEGARVADALTAAGGVLPGTDIALLNLARKVTDGELILVGVSAPPGAPGEAPPAGPPGGAAAGGKVNLNTATLAQLDSLPGVGPVLAQRILDHREKNGPFRTVSDLRQVEGIGDTRYEQLKDLVTV
ncbi:helix-hairpin-helix domain-containing protein [Phytohabitans sp. LJ34]|uniref:helix-hairpin-helix domain-containing protein n=1 Tax=Phytohabitans sp. LJ34 TaxID=3452217 RepID=UPI003F88C19F